MLDQSQAILGRLLAGTTAALDIPEHLADHAAAEYKAVGNYLTAHETTSTWDVYPQGSFVLGTVVRPSAGTEYDIDLVCLRGIAKADTTRAGLKAEIGRVLRAYVKAKHDRPSGPTSCSPSRRAWTVGYAGQFHLDVLPAIPDEDDQPSGIWLTDRQLREWQPSNPKAYANWFLAQMAQELRNLKEARATEMRKNIDEIPDYAVKTTLQQMVQVCKAHRDRYFEDRLELKPPSILITTLLAHAYLGHQDLAEAVSAAVDRVPQHIQKTASGLYMIKSPVSDENFADKWTDYPERKDAFFEWLGVIRRDLDEWDSTRGLQQLSKSMSTRFSESAVRTAMQSLGEQASIGLRAGTLASAGAMATLTTSASTRNPAHTFYGSTS